MEGIHPHLTPVILESGTEVDVVAFDFKEMLFLLFSDQQLMQEKNFAMTISNLCHPPPCAEADDYIETFLHTSSYCSTYTCM
jgi:hypothetical protein